MIQRRQSLYLLAGAILLLGFFALPVPYESVAAQVYGWFTPVVLVLCGLTAFCALGSIFLYQNRQKQRTAVVGVQILNVTFMLVLFAGLVSTGASRHVFAAGVNLALLAAFLIPILAYICFFMARRGIEQDIKLVRSMDRLR